MMELSSCNYNCKAILLAALILASLCSHGPTGCSAWSTGFQGAVHTLPPDARGDAKLPGYGMQDRETTGSSSSSLSAFTSSATTQPSSADGGVGGGLQRSGDDDGRRTPAFESAVDLKAARRLLGIGEMKASSKPSCTSNFVPCPPPRHV